MQRYTARHAIMGNLYGRALLGTVTSMSTNNILSDDFAQYPDDQFNDGQLYIYSGTVGTAVSQYRIISDFAQTSGNFTPVSAFSPQAVAGNLFEVHQHGGPFYADYNNAIDRAMIGAEDAYLTDKLSEALTMEFGRYEYPLPTGYRYLSKVQGDTLCPSGSMWGAENFEGSQGLYTAAGNQRISQAFVMDEDTWIGSIRLYLAHFGTIPTALTLTVSIQTNSSGLPSGDVVQNGTADTVLTSSIVGTYQFINFNLSKPVHLTADTTYHIVLQISSACDSTNFIGWGYDDGTSYGNGARATYGGAAWTAGTGTQIFVLGNPKITARYEDIPVTDWDVIRSDKLLYIADPIDGRVLRLIGQGQATALSADTDTIGVPEDYVIVKASAILLAGMAKGPQTDTQGMLQRAAYFDALAERYKAGMRVQPRPNSRVVDAR